MFGFGKIKEIASGYKNYILGREQELGKSRKKHCDKCPLYNKSKDMCDDSKCLNPETGDIKPFMLAGYTCGCGCYISKKILSPQSKCPLGKW